MTEEIQPQIEHEKKIHSKNQFELCYLRHRYLRKVKLNPTEAQMKPYLRIVEHMARNTFYTYKNLFSMVGFDLDDVTNISTVHLVSFLGLFALDQMVDKYEDFLRIHKDRFGFLPGKEALLNKNKANLTMFLKQRMEDLVRICRQKARNIKGFPVEEFHVFFGTDKFTKDTRLLLEDHEQFGYRKLDLASFKAIRKKASKKGTEPFEFDGHWYVCVPLLQKTLSILDLSGAGLDPYDSIHNKNPEQLLLEKQSEDRFEKRKRSFFGNSKERQANIVKGFLCENMNNPRLKDEVELAIKFLKDIGE